MSPHAVNPRPLVATVLSPLLPLTARAPGFSRLRACRRSSAAARFLSAGLVLALAQGSSQAAFPGRNGQIAFTSGRDGDYEIYVMDADGANQTRVTFTPGTDGEPAMAPDGETIAYTHNPGSDSLREIYVTNLDGSEVIGLTNNATADFEPAFSPDGSRIAFTRVGECPGPDCNNYDIFVMDADGSNVTRLTTDPATDMQPAFSPNGQRIAFRSFRNGNNGDIFVMNADGSSPTLVASSPAIDQSPSFSPDGGRIVYSSFASGNSEIWVVNADGSNPTRLTFTSDTKHGPVFSPDGTKIAFSRSGSGGLRVWVMNADGSGQSSLTTTGIDHEPDWAPAAGWVNEPPAASFTHSPAEPLPGEQVTFTSTSSDPDGPLVSQEWDLDEDGEYDDDEGPSVTYTFQSPGQKTVSIRVTDEDGAIDDETRQITVRNCPLLLIPPLPPLLPNAICL